MKKVLAVPSFPQLIDHNGAEIPSGNEPYGVFPFTRHLYNGQYWEPELGLYMYRERWMSPALGRFISPSALTYPIAELNYLFCFNNPLSFIDLFGLLAWNERLANTIDAITGYAPESSSLLAQLGPAFAAEYLDGLSDSFRNFGTDLPAAFSGIDQNGCELSWWERAQALGTEGMRGLNIAGSVGGVGKALERGTKLANKGLGAMKRGFNGIQDLLGVRKKSPADLMKQAEEIVARRRAEVDPRAGEILNMAKKADIKAIDHIVKSEGLSIDQRELLHEQITKQGLTLDEIREIAREIKIQYPNK